MPARYLLSAATSDAKFLSQPNGALNTHSWPLRGSDREVRPHRNPQSRIRQSCREAAPQVPASACDCIKTRRSGSGGASANGIARQRRADKELSGSERREPSGRRESVGRISRQANELAAPEPPSLRHPAPAAVRRCQMESAANSHRIFQAAVAPENEGAFFSRIPELYFGKVSLIGALIDQLKCAASS